MTPSRRTAALGLFAGPLAVAPGLAACAAPADAWRGFAGAGPWLNTPPLRAADLRGRVVLLNFWTYTCINSLRPLPYVRAWADRYRDRGLVVIGAHAPEFSFEHELPRVRTAVADLGIRYPVVIDNDFAIWRSFRNNAWPGFYVLDGEGRVRHKRLGEGEGEYDRTERVLQSLLSGARGERVDDPIQPVAGEGPQAAPDWQDLRSPESYTGYAKAETFAGGGLRRDVAHGYIPPPRLPLNGWSLSGDWTVRSEFAEAGAAPGAIAFRFHARDLHLVMGPGPGDRPVRVRVSLDGAAPGPDHGWDVDAAGRGELREARMYQLIRQAGPVGDRTFTIEFQAAGARVWCFTFG
ncbi:redoxin domain-containing protein [uncultured Phenylobacterium sp.]|uniref:redoxin domain-containing protein n=1 Tax=uncultured Phenylobacterium sp. TaxID=349273 RepID=UPI0025F849B1|nr:redoxin domain-containing protein [uncultured Phenylobacterium sp.]